MLCEWVYGGNCSVKCTTQQGSRNEAIQYLFFVLFRHFLTTSLQQATLDVHGTLMHCFVGPTANLKGPYFQSSLSVSLSVCLSVCLWLALLPFNVNRFWWNLVTSTLLWSSLAATIMVQIGRRWTARRLFENFPKFSKITEFEFQNSGPSFLRLCLLCIVKKFDSIRTKLTEEIHFEVCHSGNLPPIVACSGSTGGVAACSGSWRQRCANPEMLRLHHSADSDHRSANWGHSELEAQSGRKNQLACCFFVTFHFQVKWSFCSLFLCAQFT